MTDHLHAHNQEYMLNFTINGEAISLETTVYTLISCVHFIWRAFYMCHHNKFQNSCHFHTFIQVIIEFSSLLIFSKIKWSVGSYVNHIIIKGFQVKWFFTTYSQNIYKKCFMTVMTAFIRKVYQNLSFNLIQKMSVITFQSVGPVQLTFKIQLYP